MFAIEHYGVVPDILTMAKALGNGVPIGAFSTTDEIAASLNRPSASTFGGNPVSSATALAVLDYIEQQGLVERSRRVGGRLIAGLGSRKADMSLSPMSEARALWPGPKSVERPKRKARHGRISFWSA